MIIKQSWLKIAAGLIGAILMLSIGFVLVQRFDNMANDKATTQSKMVIDGKHTFRITMADTPAKQVRGLSGTTHLDDDQGMYFPMQPGPVSFWMKDMVIPIDIIWIKDGKVVGIEHEVPIPKSNTPDGDLPVYSPDVSDIDSVMEIASGRSRSLGIEVGQSAVLR